MTRPSNRRQLGENRGVGGTEMRPVEIARELRKSELMLRLRCAPTVSTQEMGGPVCRRYPAQEISVIERRWGLEGKSPGDQWEPIPCNTSMSWRYAGRLNVECLTLAAEELVRRHSILGRTLQFIDDGWRFVANPALKIRVQKLNRSPPFSDARAEHPAEAVLGLFIGKSFNLEEEGPFRIGFIEVCQDEYLIAVVIHHAFTDMYSNRICSAELAILYDSYCSNQRPSLEELGLSFLDYIASTDEWSRGSRARKFASYWTKYLAGATVLEYLRDQHLSIGGFRLSEELSRTVRELSIAERVGQNLFWEAVHHVTLHKLTGNGDITTLSVDVGRRQSELVRSVGQFINLLPIRGLVAPNESLRHIIRRMHRDRRNAAPYLSTPYRLIAECCEFSYSSSIGTMNYYPLEFQALPSLGPIQDVGSPAVLAGRLTYPYALIVVESSQIAIGWLGHARKPFSTAELGSMFERVAAALILAPDSRICDLRI